jgi:hypothetical protein
VQKLRKLNENAIREHSGGAIEHEKSGGVASLQRSLSNPIRRQVIVEFIQAHEIWSLPAIVVTLR